MGHGAWVHMGHRGAAVVARDLIGRELLSDWFEIDQARIDEFARATDDPQWIHVDPERAAAGPFGTTIAHGFLTLSLVVPLFEQALPPLEGYGMSLNYGLNRVRFTSPVPVGSRIRGRFKVEEVDDVANGEQARVAVTIELEGHEKPACVAEALFRFLRAA
jgi:acyl dehydratase